MGIRESKNKDIHDFNYWDHKYKDKYNTKGNRSNEEAIGDCVFAKICLYAGHSDDSNDDNGDE